MPPTSQMENELSIPRPPGLPPGYLRQVENYHRQVELAGAPRLRLHDFVRRAWKIIEPATEYKDSWHVGAICEHLEAVAKNQIKHLIVNVPPKCQKSLTVSVFFPVWWWTGFPSSRWLFTSYAQELSTRDSIKCRTIIRSSWYQKRWGSVYQLASDQDTKTRLKNSAMGERLTSSVNGTNTGEGCQFLIVDDPHSAQQALSDQQRVSCLTWWDLTMSTRLNDPENSHRIIIMQRLHSLDLTGHVLSKKTPGYDHLCLPMEYEPKPFMCLAGLKHDVRTEPGELLCPNRFNRVAVDQLKKDLGAFGAAGQLQQRPSPLAGGVFQRHWWEYWQPAHMDLGPVKFLMPNGEIGTKEAIKLDLSTIQGICYQTWDMTFKSPTQSKTGKVDYVVGQAHIRVGANVFILDQFRDQIDFPDTIAALQVFSRKWPGAGAKFIEDSANGPAVVATLKSAIPGLLAMPVKGSKYARATSISPYAQAGNIYLPHPQMPGAEWVDAFIETAADFPNCAFDDEIDSLSQGVTEGEKLAGANEGRQSRELLM
jgi:predicted phage terminase large subunit-like protein